MRQEASRPHLVLANAVRILAGGERFLIDAGRGLQERGWRITVQAQPGSPLAAAARTAGLIVHEVSTRANGAPWTVLPLAEWMRREQVDLVLTNFDKDLRTTGLAARLALRRITVVHSFECDEPLKSRWYLPQLYRRLANVLVFNSRCTRETVVRSAPSLAAMPHRIVAKGVDLARLGPGTAGRFQNSPLRLGFIGQLVRRKCLPMLLEALSMQPLSSDWRLRVAGDGPEREAWESACRQLGLEGRVEFCGFVDDVDGFLRETDLLVHPARREGFGYVPVEALSRGCPVLARGGGSVEEILRDAPAIQWFQDATGLCALLEEYLGGQARVDVAQLDAARQFVQKHYSLDRMTDELETLLLDSLARP